MAGESGGFRQLERVSRRRTVTLVAKLVLLLAEFGLGLDYLFRTVRFSDGGISGFPWFATAIVSVAIALALRANYSGADLVLRKMGARPISPDQPKNQAVIKVVHEMALAARIPTPRISLIDDLSPNAFAIGSDPDHCRICVTQGLVDQMDREELQGVIGHEIAHIRNCDTRLTTMVTAMFGGFGGFSGSLISRMLSRDREFLADASAVEFTHNPSALIRALEQIAKTESPLACATSGTAQLFIVDPFEGTDSGRSYNEFINEVTRIRSQPDKTEEQRDAEARNFAAHEYPRNTTAHAVSSHPPLRERIARLQALIVTLPQAQGETSQASDLTDDQLKAKFLESAMFVRNAASTDPEVLAKVTQSALLATPGERRPLAENIGGTQIIEGSTSRDPIEQTLYEANLASTGHLRAPRSPTQNRYASTLVSLFKRDAGIDSSLPSVLGVDPPSPEGIAPPDSAATEELERKVLPRMPVPMLASMRPKRAAIQPAAIDRPTGSRGGIYLFWLVIALSAGAIVATFAAR